MPILFFVRELPDESPFPFEKGHPFSFSPKTICINGIILNLLNLQVNFPTRFLHVNTLSISGYILQLVKKLVKQRVNVPQIRTQKILPAQGEQVRYLFGFRFFFYFP